MAVRQPIILATDCAVGEISTPTLVRFCLGKREHPTQRVHTQITGDVVECTAMLMTQSQPQHHRRPLSEMWVQLLRQIVCTVLWPRRKSSKVLQISNSTMQARLLQHITGRAPVGFIQPSGCGRVLQCHDTLRPHTPTHSHAYSTHIHGSTAISVFV